MVDYKGKERTNFFEVQDIEGLRESLKDYDINIHQREAGSDFYMLYPSTDDGCFPFNTYNDETNEEIHFEFESEVMPFVREGEVVVYMGSGHEKLSYISGCAYAYMRQGDDVKVSGFNLNDIYQKAANEFDIDVNTIAPCQYNHLAPARSNNPTEKNKG